VTIKDKNRKILWGKSGNRCAICRYALVVDPTAQDSESVVGDECHIISGAQFGPRHDPSYPSTNIDDLSNFMLLCRVHHKMIDDQAETYTANVLRGIKVNHENWVEQKLKDQPEISPVKIKRIKCEIPTKLPVIPSGKELLDLASGCHGAYNDYSDDLDEAETDLVGGFIQDVSDWADLVDGLEPIERIRAAKAIGEGMNELKANGFMVFAAREKQKMQGGVYASSNFFVLHLSVKRVNDPNVVTDEK